jgi:lantibiotic modifying enzyme
LNSDSIHFQMQIISGLTASKPLRAINKTNVARREIRYSSLEEIPRSLRHQVTNSIAENLINLSQTKNGAWLGFDLLPDLQRFTFRPLSLSTFSGTIGIAAYLAHFAQVLEKQGIQKAERLHKLANSILQPLFEFAQYASRQAIQRWWRNQPFGLAGSGGVLLALLSADDFLVPLEAPPKYGHSCANRLLDGLDLDLIVNAPTGLVDGIIGLVGALLILNTEKSIKIALAIGDRLVNLTDLTVDESCVDKDKQSARLLGITQDTAMHIACLAQLFKHTGIQRYIDTAQQQLAFDYLKSKDSNNHVNDMSNESWCTGQEEMVLGGLCLFDTPLWSDTVANDVDEMLEILAANISPDNSLCSGNFGRVAVLRMAFEVLGDSRWQTRSNNIESAIIETGSDENILFYSPNKQMSYTYELGLMNGLSGIGLVLIDNKQSRSFLRRMLTGGLLTCDQRFCR